MLTEGKVWRDVWGDGLGSIQKSSSQFAGGTSDASLRGEGVGPGQVLVLHEALALR